MQTAGGFRYAIQGLFDNDGSLVGLSAMNAGNDDIDYAKDSMEGTTNSSGAGVYQQKGSVDFLGGPKQDESDEGSSQADPGQLHVELTSVDFRGGLPPDYIGVQMKAWYEQSASDAKRFSGYNWIYETTANGHSQIQTDPNDFRHSGPLYYGYDDGKYGNGGDGNSELADLNFYEASKNPALIFSSTTTLVGYDGNKWVPIATANYGFQFNNGVLTTNQPVITVH